MDTTSIINALRLERDRIDAAISALTGTTNSSRRTGSAIRRRPRRRLSAAAKKRISEAAKARWAKAKRAGRTSL